METQATLRLEYGQVAVWFPYSAEAVAAVKAIPGARFCKDHDGKRWLVSASRVQRVANLFPKARRCPKVDALLRERDARRALKQLADAPQPAGNHFPLRSYQRVGVQFLHMLDRALLADEPGAGKTCQAIGWAALRLKANGRHGILCVTPSSTKYFYRDEIERSFPGWSSRVAIVEGRRGPFPTPELTDWVVVNWDILAARQSQIEDFGFAAVIFSESHKGKAGTNSQRGAAMLAIAETIPCVLAETGTPILNRPAELWPTLLALKKVEKEEWFAWHKHFCSGKQIWVTRRKRVWDFTGSSNLGELKEFLEDFTVRRTKVEVLPELPPITYTNLVVDLENRVEYDDAESEFLEWLCSVRGFDAALRARKAEAITRMNALMHLAAIGKTTAAKEILEDCAEAERKVVVFSDFLAPLDELGAWFGDRCIQLRGGTTAREKQQAEAHFQQTPSCLFALCSARAAGEAITLTAADTCLFLTLPWTPEQFRQEQGRLHRFGQTRPVEAICLLGRNTLDSELAAMLQAKQDVVSSLFAESQVPLSGGAFEAILQALGERVVAYSKK